MPNKISQVRGELQEARQTALEYRHAFECLAGAFEKADECLRCKAISPWYAEKVSADLLLMQAQILAGAPGEVKDLDTRAWDLRNRLLSCLLARQNLDSGHLANEAAWAAYLHERGIDAREVKGSGSGQEEKAP